MMPVSPRARNVAVQLGGGGRAPGAGQSVSQKATKGTKHKWNSVLIGSDRKSSGSANLTACFFVLFVSFCN
jgi:hypothetical protein